MPEEPSFLTPSTSEQVAREAELMLLRAMSRSMEAVATEMTAHRSDIGQIKTDIAVIMVRLEASEKMETLCAVLRSDIESLKARNAKQDGAVSLATIMKDFGPWLVSLGVLFWGLFSRKG